MATLSGFRRAFSLRNSGKGFSGNTRDRGMSFGHDFNHVFSKLPIPLFPAYSEEKMESLLKWENSIAFGLAVSLTIPPPHRGQSCIVYMNRPVKPRSELAHLHFWKGLETRAARAEKFFIENGIDIGEIKPARSIIQRISSN